MTKINFTKNQVNFRSPEDGVAYHWVCLSAEFLDPAITSNNAKMRTKLQQNKQYKNSVGREQKRGVLQTPPSQYETP